MICAFSEPTTLPEPSYRREGNSKLPLPQKRVTPSRPLTVPSAEENVHVAPASNWPVKVIVPAHCPPSGPVALNFNGPADGTFVVPGVSMNVPVGSTGVPAHVQVVVAPADPAPRLADAREAAASATTVRIGRLLIACSLSI